MTTSQLAVFAAIYFVAVATPGPGLAAVVARGLGQGLKAGPAFVAGFVAGDFILMTLAVMGLSTIAQRFELLFLAIKYAGCLYLLYLGWKMWTSPAGSQPLGASLSEARSWPAFLGTLALTLGNPKAIIFFVSILPLVVDLTAMTPAIYLQLVASGAIIIATVMGAALVLAHRARQLFTSPRALKRINRITGSMMVGVAMAIALRK